MKVYVDPRCIITYSSYYLYGLYEYFGKSNVRFSNKFFRDVDMSHYNHRNDALMLFVIIDELGSIKKEAIDFRDGRDILLNAYYWSHVYAKINYNKEFTVVPEPRTKLLSIPPSFAVKIYNLPQTIFHTIRNSYLVFGQKSLCGGKTMMSLKTFIANYIYLYFWRQKLEQYEASCKRSNQDYIFFISTLWSHENCVASTNVFRSEYMLYCHNHPKILFEGGFLIKDKNRQGEVYERLRLKGHIPISAYIDNTKKSLIVFNTPSCWDCHGWKLGEFLAMGKAIISTPITNELPYPLIHRQNIYIINSKEELYKAVDLLIEDHALRTSLEENAKAYYREYVAPEKVIESIVNKLRDI